MAVFLIFAFLIAFRGLLVLSWGPGLHIQLTRRVLEMIRLLREPSPSHRLVLAHPRSFLYGNIAADIVNFKNYGGMKNHCHNWNIQERLDARARTDVERAFILGYLCHLAADVIAHNHFIPYHCVHGLPPIFLGHAYWEALADAGVTDDEWEVVAGIRRDRTLHQNDRLIWNAVRWRALGARSNKWIFNNVLLVSLRHPWRELVRRAHARHARYPIDRQFLDHCRTGCIHNMMAVFDPALLSALKLRDPTGREALRGARRMRREMIERYGSAVGAREPSRKQARLAYWSF